MRHHRLDHGGAWQAVRAGAQRRRVCLDDAPGALAVHDLHRDRARVRAAELGADRHPEPLPDRERHLDEEPVLGGCRPPIRRRGADHLQRGERVRVEPGAVPRVEPVGDHVLRLAPPDHGGDGGHAVVFGTRAQHGEVGRRLLGRCRRGAPRRARRRRGRGAGASQGGRLAPSTIPCHRHTMLPSCTGASHSAAPRCGQAPGPTCSPPAASRQATSSRPATTRPNARPGRTSRLPASTCHPPVGRGLRPLQRRR